MMIFHLRSFKTNSSLWLLVVCFLFACKQNKPEINRDFQVNVRLSGDPGSINPMIGGAGAIGREVYPYIFIQLGEYNPITLELEPILAKAIPDMQSIEEGIWAGGMKIDIEILDEAVWADGQPVTGEDYLFTMKAAKNPLVNSGSWRAILKDLVSVEVDPENKKSFSVIMKDEYLLGLELVLSCEILPAHIYDPEGILSKYSMEDLINDAKIEDLVKQDSALIQFVQTFNSLEYNLEKCSGAGPYELTEWESNQYIILRKKENWWGDEFPDRPFLTARPTELIFQIIPDETSAITQLKAGGLDVMRIVNSEDFRNLMDNENTANQFSFHTPQLTQFYFLCLNNRHPALRDRDVRWALAHLVNVDDIIENIEGGDAQRIVGTIPRFSNSYHSELKPVPFDVNRARQLLENAGWLDSDNDGILEKSIDGKVEELKFRIFVTQSDLGKRISLLMKEDAIKAGVEIEIIQKDYRTYYQENMLKGDYEIAAMAFTQSLAEYDPYARWHSDNAILGGSNLAFYTNEAADAEILNIQDSGEKEESIPHYRALQEIMYEDQPVIFLYSPVARIVVNNRLDPLISVKRPGYFVNLFELAGESVSSTQ